jgi:hypothetical protein
VKTPPEWEEVAAGVFRRKGTRLFGPSAPITPPAHPEPVIPAPELEALRHGTEPRDDERPDAAAATTAERPRPSRPRRRRARGRPPRAAETIERTCQAFEAALREDEYNQRRAERLFLDAGVTRSQARRLLKEHAGTRWRRVPVSGRRGPGGETVVYRPLSRTPSHAAQVEGSCAPHPEHPATYAAARQGGLVPSVAGRPG